MLFEIHLLTGVVYDYMAIIIKIVVPLVHSIDWFSLFNLTFGISVYIWTIKLVAWN